MGEAVDLKMLYQILKKRVKMILALTVAMVAISGVLSYFVLTPKYQVMTQLIVRSANSDRQINEADIYGNLQLMNTYSIILTSPAILDKVIDQLNLDTNIEDLTKQIKVKNEENTQVIGLTVTDQKAELARDIANKIAEVFQQEIGNIMNVDNVSVLAKAEVTADMKPVSPNSLLNMVIALTAGMMMGVGLAILLEYLDNTVKTAQDIKTLVGLPVLGEIPIITTDDMKVTPYNNRAANQHISKSVNQ